MNQPCRDLDHQDILRNLSKGKGGTDSSVVRTLAYHASDLGSVLRTTTNEVSTWSWGQIGCVLKPCIITITTKVLVLVYNKYTTHDIIVG